MSLSSKVLQFGQRRISMSNTRLGSLAEPIRPSGRE